MNDSYPIGDFDLEQIGKEKYRLILFLDLEVNLDNQLCQWQDRLTKAKWNAREQSLEIELFTDDEVYSVIDLIKSNQAMEPGYITLMEEVLANESLVSA